MLARGTPNGGRDAWATLAGSEQAASKLAITGSLAFQENGISKPWEAPSEAAILLNIRPL